MGKVLIACEESQAVCKAFRAKGFEAYSCDIQECSGGHPEWHIQGDALAESYSGKYLAMIAFPPCTHLCVSGARWFKEKKENGLQKEGFDFFMALANAPIDFICLENPVGIVSSLWRKPTQIIQPYYFGDSERKTTCLWLKGLPKLKATNIVEPVFSKSGLTKTHIGYGSKNNSKMRSKTFQGIADAMAEQWGNFLLKKTSDD